MADNYASNYSGKKGGKANIKYQGQTSGAYGNDPKVQSRHPGEPPELRP